MELYPEEKIRQTFRPEVGDVIVCEAFARGWRQYRCEKDGSDGYRYGEPYGPIRVMDVLLKVNEYHDDCHDDTRGEAKLVVTESHASLSTVSWPNDYRKWEIEPNYESEAGWLVRACRLCDDGTYDPEGEIVEFTTYSTSEARGSVRKVNALAVKEGWTNPEQVERIVETPIILVGRMTRTVHFE